MSFIILSVLLVPVPYLLYLFGVNHLGLDPDLSRNTINAFVEVAVGGPHMMSTFLRTGLDRDFSRRYPMLLRSSIIIPLIVVSLAFLNLTLLLTIFFFWAMLHVLQAAADDPDFPVDICLAGAVGEEIVMVGSRVMAERRPPVDAAVVGEPTELRIITAQKGAVRWRVRTHGVAAHSAMPEQGHNAIEDMAEAIPAIARGIEPHLNDRTHPILGNATWNVGTIRGGAGVNVVPDRCEIEIDRRLVPGDTSDEVLAHVDAALDELRASDPELRIDRDPPFVDIPPLETPEEAPVVRAAQQAVAAAGISPEPLGVAYATDAAMLSGLGGIPSVVLGPGNIAQAHTNDEWIELAQLEQVVGIYLGICRAFAEIAA